MKKIKKSIPFIFVALCWLALLYCIKSGADNSGYFWQWFRVEREFLHLGADHSFSDFLEGPMVQGLLTSLKLMLFSMILVCPLTIVLTTMHLAGGPVARFLAISYIEIARNTPLLVQLFIFYIIIAPGLGFTADTVAVITLALCHAAFMSEIVRAGILCVPSGQYEAALSLGLKPHQAAALIIAPQTLRHCIPPLLNQSVILIKDTSLVSIISVTELTFQAKFYASASFTVFETWITVGLIYLAICLAFSLLTYFARISLEKNVIIE